MLELRLAKRVCPICGAGAARKLFAQANLRPQALDRFAFSSRKTPEYMHWRLQECRGCDVLYADPAPSAEELAALYNEAAFGSDAEAGHASRTYGRFLPGIVARLPDQDGALDIGTGDGAFLSELLAAGFTGVVGVEPSAAPIARADPTVRSLIRHDVFRPGVFRPHSFSLVTCFQTIEHLSDPLRVCREVWRVLKPGGAIFLIGHNRRALSALLLGRKSPIFDIEHLQLFSPRSLRRLLETAGFRGIRVAPVYNRYPLSYWLRLFPLPPPWKTRVLTALATRPLGERLISVPAGNMVAIAHR